MEKKEEFIKKKNLDSAHWGPKWSLLWEEILEKSINLRNLLQ